MKTLQLLIIIGFFFEMGLFMLTGFFIDRNVLLSIYFLFCSLFTAWTVGDWIKDSGKQEILKEERITYY